MTTIIRTLTIAAALAGSLSTAAAAQSDAAAPRSRTTGFNLGAFVHQVSGRVPGFRDESGTGLGVHVGYGIHENVSVYARGALAPNKSYVSSPDFEATHFDLGLRVSPGTSSWPIRPFLQGALTRREAYVDDIAVSYRGLGFTAGGGLEYFVRHDLAIEVGVSRSFGDFTEFDAPETDGWEDIDDGIDITSTRIEIGVSWHPFS